MWFFGWCSVERGQRNDTRQMLKNHNFHSTANKSSDEIIKRALCLYIFCVLSAHFDHFKMKWFVRKMKAHITKYRVAHDFYSIRALYLVNFIAQWWIWETWHKHGNASQQTQFSSSSYLLSSWLWFPLRMVFLCDSYGIFWGGGSVRFPCVRMCELGRAYLCRIIQRL